MVDLRFRICNWRAPLLESPDGPMPTEFEGGVPDPPSAAGGLTECGDDSDLANGLLTNGVGLDGI
jgi:hypothetical protein